MVPTLTFHSEISCSPSILNHLNFTRRNFPALLIELISIISKKFLFLSRRLPAVKSSPKSRSSPLKKATKIKIYLYFHTFAITLMRFIFYTLAEHSVKMLIVKRVRRATTQTPTPHRVKCLSWKFLSQRFEKAEDHAPSGTFAHKLSILERCFSGSFTHSWAAWDEALGES